MKQSWQIKKLGELCDFIGDGDWIESKDQSTKGIRLIQTGNIGNGIYLDKAHHAHFISEETFSRLRCTEIFPGDCLISRLPDPVGRACIIPKAAEKMITAVDCTIIRFNKQILPEYFVLYAQSNKYFKDIDSESIGATRKRISRKNLEKISVPLPPLEEQKRIVAVLDKKFAQIETLKTAAEKNLQNIKQLFQTELEKAFSNTSWEKKILSDVCLQKQNKKWKDENNNTEYQYIDLSAVDRETNAITETQLITKKTAPSRAQQIVKTGDVLFGTTRPTLKRVCLLSDEYDEQICSTGFCVIRANNKEVTPDWLYYQFFNDAFYKYIEPLQKGASYPAVTDKEVLNYEIPLPPLEEQKCIVAHLDSLSEKVHQLEEIYTKQLSDCDELKQSLLQKAFEGEL